MSVTLYLFYAILIIAIARLFIRLILSIAYNLMRRHKSLTVFPKISIIVPAYNEEITIESCLKSLLSLDYPDYEVIVVDDGSTDRTLERASQFKEVRVFHQENSGKPNALNKGVSASQGEIVITVDADTILGNQALKRIAARYEKNKNLGALAGNVKVRAEFTLLNVIQSAEYATGINLIRKGQSTLGSVMIVPGPVAALRREAVEKAGFFSDDTFAEDFDITLKIIKKGYRVEYEEESLAYTDAPKTIEDLIKQRRRWYRGMIQVLDKHKDMYFNTKYGSAGTLGIPNLWLDAISPLLNMGLLLVTLLTWIFTGEVYSSMIGIAIYLVISLAISVVGISLEAKPQKRSYLAIPLLIFYNTFLDGIRIMSLTEEVISTIMEWEKPKR